jgi:hypothetical protein
MPGFPIRKSPDQRLFSAYPKLFAANRVLHRLLMPRHPPYALISLDTSSLMSITRHILMHSPRIIIYTVVKEPTTNKWSPIACAIFTRRANGALSEHHTGKYRVRGNLWWSWTGSNRRPQACKARALPTELQPRKLVGLGRFELPTSRLSGVRSNQLSYRPSSGEWQNQRTNQPRTASPSKLNSDETIRSRKAGPPLAYRSEG